MIQGSRWRVAGGKRYARFIDNVLGEAFSRVRKEIFPQMDANCSANFRELSEASAISCHLPPATCYLP